MGEAFPNVTANLLSAKTPQTPDERSILLIGAMTSGTAISGDLVSGLISESEINNAFGRDSHIAKAGRALMQQLSVSRIRPKVSAIGIEDNIGGIASTGNIIFGGTATETGTIEVAIDSSVNGIYELDVSIGDTASDIADELVTRIAENLNSNVTASNSSGNVTITSINKGSVGDSIGLGIRGSIAGLNSTVIAMSGGATDPNLTNLFDVIEGQRFTSIIYPQEWGTTTLTTETESRFNVDNDILDGLGVVCNVDTYANLNSTLDTLNAKTLAYLVNKSVSKTANSNLVSISGITQAAGVATVTTSSNHGLTSGMTVTISGADQTEYNLTATITVATPTTFTYAVDAGAVTPATGTILGVLNKTLKSTGAIFENPIVIASQAAAIRDLRLTVNSNTSSLTTSGQALGGSFFGGIPYHNTPFVNLPTIEIGEDFTDEEALELQNLGGWVLRNNPANTVIISNEAVTTYKTDILGNDDITYKYVNYFDTLTICRDYVFKNLKADLSQHILTTGKLIAGRPMVNEKGFIATMMGYYGALSGINGDNNYVLLRAGSAEAKAFRQAIEDSIAITLSTGTITAESIANIVTQVRNVIINFTPTFE